jgi:lipid-binding SYLF domain-containing protein
MKTSFVTALLCLATVSGSTLAAQNINSLNDRVDAASQVVRDIMKLPDGAVPDSIVKKAVCIAVIPGVIKGAFIVGASYGQGVVTCRTGRGWSGPVFIRLAGGSIGFQAGGQATDLVLVAVNDRGFQSLLNSKFKIGADAAAAAGPVGRHAAAATDIALNAQLLTYSRTKGIFAGIDLNGATVSQNTDDTKLFYGNKEADYPEILKGKVPVPTRARTFVATIARYFRSTK